MVCPSSWEDYYMLIYTHCWELMNSVGGYGSLSLPLVMKVMVCHFVSDSHEVMTAFIDVLPIIVVVEISLQLHQASSEKEKKEQFYTLNSSSLPKNIAKALRERASCSNRSLHPS
jgi:predicted flavoprotein YhiN